jgi:hypothetical protein
MDHVYNGQTLHVEDSVKYTVKEFVFGFTPYTPETEHIAPMPIPEANWKENGVGIRRNGDYDDGKTSPDWTYGTASNKENDLIPLTIDITPLPGIEYRLKSTSSTPVVRLWESDLKGGYPLATYTDMGVLISNDITVYAEYISEGSAHETFILSAIATATGQEHFSEEIVFRPFDSVTCAFVGEFEQAGDPVQSPGVNDWVITQLLNGYDVHVWDDGHDWWQSDDCDEWGNGPALDEIANAINNQGVTQVALLGYSHGGGTVYNLSKRLFYDGSTCIWYEKPVTFPEVIHNPYQLVFTSYIDTIMNDRFTRADPEDRRPEDSLFHLRVCL